MAAVRWCLCLLLLCFSNTKAHQAKNAAKTAYVSLDDATQMFKVSDVPSGNDIVSATFIDNTNSSGWAYLDIQAKAIAGHNDSVRAYGAGVAEAFLTRESINLQWQNTQAGYCEKPYSDYCQRLEAFLTSNLMWVKNQIIKYRLISPYWHHVALFYEQLAGLQNEYDKSSLQLNMDIDVFKLYMFQYGGDLEDLEMALHKPERKHVFGSGSCSALIKVAPGNEELYVAQDTWSSYQSMLRILKRYQLGFSLFGDPTVPAPGDRMTFSSYPGSLMSGDDYYHLSSDMVTMETTIGNSNMDRLKYIGSQSVLEGIRSLVANRIATSGEEWAKIFSAYNSGTYNNMWMIVDMKQFKPNNATLFPGVLTVLEQIPGMIEYKDLTPVLEQQGYFASYNVPYFPKIFNASGCPANVKKYGDWFTYNFTARANIFRRDQHTIVDMPSFLKVMRYNDFTHDPFSKCNCTPPYSAENGISSRSDLNPANGTYAFGALGHRSHGGIDAKITSYTYFMKKSNTFVAISSPTYNQQSPFQWSKADFQKECPHFGHPDLFNFSPVMYNGTVPATKWESF